MPPLVQTFGLGRVYGSRHSPVQALTQVDLTIDHGEFVAIVGPSGSGKSTLMSILGMLDRPSAGRYLFAGEDVGDFGYDRLAAHRNRYIGFVFQAFNLLPRLDALHNVELPLLYRGLDRERRRARSLAALDAVGLGHRAGHRPTQLSGGEQQRVAIARALVAEPRMLLADEPTGALDSTTGLDVLSLFQSVSEAGHTVVLITHDMSVAEHAERIVSLRDGRIADDAPVAARRRAALRPAGVGH